MTFHLTLTTRDASPLVPLLAGAKGLLRAVGLLRPEAVSFEGLRAELFGHWPLNADELTSDTTSAREAAELLPQAA